MTQSRAVPQELMDEVRYEDGHLYWKKQKYKQYWDPINEQYIDGSKGNRKMGVPLGTKNKEGYLQVVYEGHTYQVHRVIYWMNEGEIPGDMVIDHINQDKTDNRFNNLRCVSKRVNMLNSKKVTPMNHSHSASASPH